MKNLRKEYEELIKLTKKEEIIVKLQTIMSLFIHNYQLEVNNKIIKPIEVEAYYFKSNIFEDKYMHCDPLQLGISKDGENRFGHPYFHKMNNALKTGNYKGMDICLSNSTDAFFSLLIRSAEIDGERIYGPSNCVKEIFGDDDVYKAYYEGEQTKAVIKTNPEKNNGILHCSPRYGLSQSPDGFPDWDFFHKLPLRMVRGEFKRIPTVTIKNKRKLELWQ